MQSIVNQPFLDKRAKYAKWGSYIGFGALFVGLVTTTRNPLLAYVFLLIGLLGASTGAYFTGRYVRKPRFDQSLEEALGGLDKRYVLFNYYLPSNHVLLSHFGLTVIEPRAQDGNVSHEKGRWHHRAGFRKVLQLFGEPALGKPDQDLAREIKWVKEWIDEVLPEDDVPVNGVVVFTSPRAKLTVRDPSAPIVTAADLARHMKDGLKGQPMLTTAKQNELRQLLDQVVAQAK
ncbi:MAG: nuclease-related domain-containing protein [Chloroflexota bacterium]